MPISVQHEPPISMTGQLALAAGAATGEARRREQEADRQQRQRELTLQLRQRAWESQQELLGRLAAQQMQFSAGQQELAAQLQSREAIAAAQIEQQREEAEMQGLKAGTLSYTPFQRRQLDEIETARLNIQTSPQFGPIGQPHPVRQAALERLDARRAMIRPVPVPANEQPPKIPSMIEPGKELSVGEWEETPYGIFSIEASPKTGQPMRVLKVPPDKMPQHLTAIQEAKAKADEARHETAEARLQIQQQNTELAEQKFQVAQLEGQARLMQAETDRRKEQEGGQAATIEKHKDKILDFIEGRRRAKQQRSYGDNLTPEEEQQAIDDYWRMTNTARTSAAANVPGTTSSSSPASALVKTLDGQSVPYEQIPPGAIYLDPFGVAHRKSGGAVGP